MTLEDWMDNKSWFDIKLLIDSSTPDNTQPTKNDSFSEHIGKILEKLGLPTNKKLHLGRNIGAKLCDMAELSSEDIRRIGNWNPSIYDDSYSSKLPIAAIRSMAGFQDKVYFCPRSAVEVPEALLHATPIGKWCYKAYDALLKEEEGAKHTTALQFLPFMQEINKISIQDAAAMVVLHSDRTKHHPFFSDIEAFKSDAFKAYVETMRAHLANVEDPYNASLNKVVPAIQRFHQAHNQDLCALKEGIGALKIAVEGVGVHIDRSADARDRKLASSFLEAANVLLGAKQKEQEMEEDIRDIVAMEVERPRNRNVAVPMQVDTPAPRFGAPNLQVAGTLNSNNSNTGSRKEQVGATEATEAFDFTSIRLCPKHHTLASVCDEWYGRNRFTGKGLLHYNQRFGDKWRRHMKGSQKQHYSKLSRIVEAIEKQANAKDLTVEESCAELEELFVKARTGITKMVAILKERGLVETKKTRGRKTARERATA